MKTTLKIPFELFKGWKSSLKHMRVWGCSSKVRIYNPREKKLDLRTISGCFIGYVERSKGYRCKLPHKQFSTEGALPKIIVAFA